MVNRRGISTLGCVFWIVLVGAVAYSAYEVGRPLWRRVQFEDRIKAEAKFAAHRSDAVIARRLRTFADSIGLPESAQNLRVRRAGGVIYIYAEYCEHVVFPVFSRDVCFSPQVSRSF
jgi:hypothetical protein